MDILAKFRGMSKGASFGLCALALHSQPAHASGGQATDADAPTPAPTLVVTGTRMALLPSEADNSLITLSLATIASGGDVNLESALRKLPQFGVGADATTNPLGGGGYASLNLRGLGEQRNLVLLNGRRLPAASARGVVDINSIPAIALERIDILTGGTSAVYGSDAISGVVNFRLHDQFEGIRVSAKARTSVRGDGRQSEIGFIGGSRLLGDRAHVMVAVSQSARGLVTGSDRCSFYCGGGVYSSYLTNGRILSPFSAASPNAAAALFNGKYGISGTVPTLTNFGVNDDGTVFSAIGGQNLDPVGQTYIVLPFGSAVNQATGPDNFLIQPQTKSSAIGIFILDISDDTKFYAKTIYSDSFVKTNVGYAVSAPSPLNPAFQGGLLGGNFILSPTNPFIPADLQLLLSSRANPNAPIYYFKRFNDLGRRIYRESYKTWQAELGLRGNFGSTGWDWDVYYLQGRTNQRETLVNAVLASRVQRVLLASDGGKAICDGGYRPFGSNNSVSSACRDWLTTKAESTQVLTQEVVEATVRGIASGVLGRDLRFALTATQRIDGYAATPDCSNRASADRDCVGIEYANIAASVAQFRVPRVSQRVREVAGELFLPLAENLSVNLGAKWSDNKDYGNVWTWRGGFDWAPLSLLRLRGGYDRAVRTPSFAEAVIPVSGNVANLAIIDPCSLSSPLTRARPEIRALCLAQMSQAAFSSYVQTSPAISAPLLGNPALRPERSESFRLGVTLTPDFATAAFDELAFSVDYYSIRVSNPIGLYPVAQTTLAGCFNLDPVQSNPNYSPTNPFCRLIERNGTGVISTISQPYVNMGAIKTDGIDIGIEWEAALDGTTAYVGVDSRITRVLAYKIQNAPNASFQDFSGTLGDGLLYTPSASGSVAPQPHWRSLTKLHYRSAQFKLEFTWRFISGMKDPNAIANSSPLATPDYSLFDLALNFMLRDGLTLSTGSENLFDRKPPTITYRGMTMASVYDVVGRSVYISARAEF